MCVSKIIVMWWTKVAKLCVSEEELHGKMSSLEALLQKGTFPSVLCHLACYCRYGDGGI